MASACDQGFEHKPREDGGPSASQTAPMINTVMNRREWAILLFLAFIWGGAFFFIGVAVKEIPPITYVWLRLTIAAAALWLFLRWRGTPVSLPRGAVWPILLLALLNNVFPFLLFGWGQTHIASGLASILNATTPIWGVIAAHFLTRDEPLTPRRLAGVMLGFGGVAVMIAPGLAGGMAGGDLLPELACVLATLCYALAGVHARKFKAMGVAPESVAGAQLIAGAIVMLPTALLVDRPWLHAAPSLGAIAALVALAIVCTGFAYILYFRLIASAGATNALLSTLLVPPFAILLGVMFLGETLAAEDIAGLALIALGFAAIDGRPLGWLRLSAARLRPAA